MMRSAKRLRPAVASADAAADPTDATSHVYAKPIVPTEAVTEVEPEAVGEETTLIAGINRTLHEIMAAYPEVRIFGEDVADPKGGVFKATVGLTEAYGEERSFNAPPRRSSDRWPRRRNGRRRCQNPMAEIQFADFIHPGFDQIVSEAARIHYRSAGRWSCPMVLRVPYGGGHPRCALPQPIDRGVLRPRARSQDRHPIDTGGRQRAVVVGDRGPRPRHDPRTQEALPPRSRSLPRRRAPGAAWQRPGCAAAAPT